MFVIFITCSKFALQPSFRINITLSDFRPILITKGRFLAQCMIHDFSEDDYITDTDHRVNSSLFPAKSLQCVSLKRKFLGP